MKKPANTAKVPPASKKYAVTFSNQANKQFQKLPLAAAQSLKVAIASLATNPRPSGVKKLKAKEGYRIRVGDYRVLYSILDAELLVEVVKVGQRGNFYDE